MLIRSLQEGDTLSSDGVLSASSHLIVIFKFKRQYFM